MRYLTKFRQNELLQILDKTSAWNRFDFCVDRKKTIFEVVLWSKIESHSGSRCVKHLKGRSSDVLGISWIVSGQCSHA